jgi:hypothetical protein
VQLFDALLVTDSWLFAGLVTTLNHMGSGAAGGVFCATAVPVTAANARASDAATRRVSVFI